MNNIKKKQHTNGKTEGIVIVRKDKDGNSIITPEGQKWAERFLNPNKTVKNHRPDTLS